jgi:hypothetical protein
MAAQASRGMGRRLIGQFFQSGEVTAVDPVNLRTTRECARASAAMRQGFRRQTRRLSIRRQD